MKTVLCFGSGLLLLAGVASASAATAPAVDAGPVIQNSRAMAAADQMPTMSVRQQLMSELTTAGFTDITMMPSSFYVHAKNKAGDPVAMVIGPDGFTEVTELPMKSAAAPGATAAKPVAASPSAPKP